MKKGPWTWMQSMLTVGKHRMENRYFGEMQSFEYAEEILKNSGAAAGETGAPKE